MGNYTRIVANKRYIYCPRNSRRIDEKKDSKLDMKYRNKVKTK